MKHFIKILTVVGYILSTQSLAFAGTRDLVSSFESLQSESFNRFTAGAEFMAGQEAGTVMMKVNLWGAVRKPGIYHVPVKTDFVALMSFAGGPNDNAIIEDIIIKRQQGNKQTRINVDLSQLIHGEYNGNLTLQPDDIIVVPASEPWISQNTFTVAIFASTIATIILSAVLIDKNTD